MDRVVVVPYDPEWPKQFERLRDRLLAALGDLPAEVEHVGSTAVPGLAAKPIVDLDVVVQSTDGVEPAIERITAVGYLPGGRDFEVSGLYAFRWPSAEPRHHLYVVIAGTARHRERLFFRDFLRANPAKAKAYGDLKATLAREHESDWNSYSQRKSIFVEGVLNEAGFDQPITRVREGSRYSAEQPHEGDTTDVSGAAVKGVQR